MNILMVGSGFAFSTKDVGEGFSEAFRRLGHTVWDYETNRVLDFFQKAIQVNSIFDPELNMSKNDFFELIAQGILNYCVRYAIDFVFVIHGANIHTGIITNVKKLGIKTAVYLTDEPQQVNVSKEFTPYYDYVFTNEKNTVKVHGEDKTMYLPTAVDPNVFYPRRVPRNYLSDVLIGGSLFAERMDALDKLEKELKRYRLKIVGNSRRNFKSDYLNSIWRRGSVSIEEMAKFDAGTKIALDIPRNEMVSEYGRTNPGILSTTVSPRVFEVPAAGALLLTWKKREAVKELFPDDIVALYDEIDEIPKIIEHYMKNRKEREQLIARARSHVLKNHTYENRAKDVLKFTGADENRVMVPVTLGNAREAVNDLTMNTWKNVWAENFKRNKPELSKSKTLDDLFKSSEDKVGVLISSAPSVNNIKDDLKGFLGMGRTKRIVIGANSGFRIMCEWGIEPDYFIAIHPEDNVVRHFDGVDTSKHEMLASSVLHPEVIKAWKGKKRFFHTMGIGSVHPNILDEVKLTILGSALSVVFTGISCLIGMGCKKILIGGVDLAYTGGKKYYDETIRYEDIQKEGLLIAKDVKDGAVITNLLYNEMRETLVELTSAYKQIEFFNITDAGILYGPNIKVKSLTELGKEETNVSSSRK